RISRAGAGPAPRWPPGRSWRLRCRTARGGAGRSPYRRRRPRWIAAVRPARCPGWSAWEPIAGWVSMSWCSPPSATKLLVEGRCGLLVATGGRLPPAAGGGDVVEGVDVQALQPVGGVGECRGEVPQQLGGPPRPGRGQVPQPAAVLAQHAGGLAHADLAQIGRAHV